MRSASAALAGAEVAASQSAGSGLAARVVVGLLLAVSAVALIWLGSWPFALLVAVGVSLIFHEWSAMHAVPLRWQIAAIAVIAVSAFLAQIGQAPAALAVLAGGALVLPAFALATGLPGSHWLTSGLLYAGLPAISLIWLRQQPEGFALVMWTMGVVWATDIFAYFVGRAVGGPKIWTAISPNKTWAGLIGGMKAAAIFAGFYAWLAGWPTHPLLYALLGAALAVLAQSGDFFESWLKRRAGVKDSGSLLPGHGGVMDRVDGLIPVVCAVALFVALTNGAVA
ncbi:phosphatidate cytidylyltransferase [Sandaracinobacteroides hominis]|uniref:phosphatidate cytidylyltransferase n=1 Tax=Sandaracinobacteroides hominis TaxID=2780086 RepID=UPI0018F64E9C|nr:phosphatidate cytidylyltransferase [Sandaracinobacteroides hominis]